MRSEVNIDEVSTLDNYYGLYKIGIPTFVETADLSVNGNGELTINLTQLSVPINRIVDFILNSTDNMSIILRMIDSVDFTLTDKNRATFTLKR